MKNIIALSLSITLGLASLAMAAPSQLRTPSGSDGNSINHPLYGGYQYSYIGQTTEYQVCDGRCLLAGIFRGTGAAAAEIAIRDTSILGNASTATLMWLGNFTGSESETYKNPIAFPLQTTYGITVKLSSISASERVVVVYLDMDPGVAGGNGSAASVLEK